MQVSPGELLGIGFSSARTRPVSSVKLLAVDYYAGRLLWKVVTTTLEQLLRARHKVSTTTVWGTPDLRCLLYSVIKPWKE